LANISPFLTDCSVGLPRLPRESEIDETLRPTWCWSRRHCHRTWCI